jgi:hypothetical protein
MRFTKENMPEEGQWIYYPNASLYDMTFIGELYDPSSEWMREDAEKGRTYSTSEEAKAIVAKMLEIENIIEAARAVIERWDSPNWTIDSVHTKELINNLRKAIE